MTGNVVWILGAGFSKSLGAPLLSGLLSRESLVRVLAVWGDAETALGDQKLATQVVQLYLGGVSGFEHISPRARLWEHAEEYLERLDHASREQTPHDLETRMLRGFAEEIHGSHVGGPHWLADTAGMISDRSRVAEARLVALKLAAAECCVFTKYANLQSERWRSYVNWALNGLGRNDTIITFNWDRVPELLSDELKSRTGTTLWIPTPNQLAAPPPSAQPLVLKLHGSVDWLLKKEGLERQSDPEAVLHCAQASSMGIATPGPSKTEMIDGVGLPGKRRNTGPLNALWVRAEEVLQEATAVVFLGYRIPPTDAFTRDRLLSSISSNVYTRNTDQFGKQLPNPIKLPVHTVLGSDTNHHDSRRLKGVLEESDVERRIGVKRWPMLAEDFIAVVGRQRLFQLPEDV